MLDTKYYLVKSLQNYSPLSQSIAFALFKLIHKRADRIKFTIAGAAVAKVLPIPVLSKSSEYKSVRPHSKFANADIVTKIPCFTGLRKTIIAAMPRGINIPPNHRIHDEGIDSPPDILTYNSGMNKCKIPNTNVTTAEINNVTFNNCKFLFCVVINRFLGLIQNIMNN